MGNLIRPFFDFDANLALGWLIENLKKLSTVTKKTK